MRILDLYLLFMIIYKIFSKEGRTFMNIYIKIAITYIVIINLAGLLSMFIDKKKAIKNKWRIPEKNLFLIAILGGSVGSITGMHLFRHKTKHWYFKYGMPAILIIQLMVMLLLSDRFFL